ncbi:SDR family oxidoreductase [Paenibacillus flagellatus]|uniref:dTDP-4-dehydrorhamnose reductase n=1 Tax=Paenibacillus flagellatus TaxID=2211139 RepID=A0A2V5KUD0_9BACL|nr:sugar nucleotide-binding protein [Paenibacillus flagellatus]PYI52936.1 NAD(P)-dependent oxidoreductase [Paenibacillus flagellatus]
MKYLILGGTGMAGHMICIFLQEQGHDVTTISRRPFPYCRNIVGDILNTALIEKEIKEGGYNAVINCAGLLNHFAEVNKYQAVLINSYLPHFLNHITLGTKTKIIQMSTDCVFSGKNGSYSESSSKDGETFYDRSKALGELINDKDLTFRNSIIGPDMNPNGIGLFNWFMKQKRIVNGYTKAIWTGVTTLVLAKAMEKAVQQNLTGLYHLVNNKTISKYELLVYFNEYFRNNEIVINSDDKIAIDKSLINNRDDFDFQVPDYEEMIIEMAEWVQNHKKLYPHYFQ